MFNEQQGDQLANWHLSAQWSRKWSLKSRTVKVSHNMEHHSWSKFRQKDRKRQDSIPKTGYTFFKTVSTNQEGGDRKNKMDRGE